MLDAYAEVQQGVQYDGEEAQPALVLEDPFLRLVPQAWALLANGMGGIDWAGLPVVAAHLGIDDTHRLIDCLYTMKTHQPDKAGADTPQET